MGKREVAIPEGYEIWRSLITQYNLYEIRPFAHRAGLISSLCNRFLRSPFDLAALTFSEISALCQNPQSKGDLILLWKSSLFWKECYHNRPILIGQRQEDNAQKLTKPLRADSIQQTIYYKDWVSLAAKLGLPKEFVNSPHNEHRRRLSGCGDDPASIGDFLRLGAWANARRPVNGSLICFSSGIDSYASFSSLIGRPLLPPLESTVILWGSCFRPGRTSRNYTGNLRKAFLLTGHPLDWNAPSVREISNGLKHAQDSPFRFPNFLYTQDLYRIINTLCWIGEFPQIASLSLLCSLSIPSDAICIRRAHDSGRLAGFVPHHDKVLIGGRPCSGADCLILKLAWRKNLARGRILKRICLCADPSHQARKIRPPHRIWPTIQERVPQGN